MGKMKKLFVLLTVLTLLAGAASAESLQSMTGLDETVEKLADGVTIDRIYYTDGYGFSTSEFTTTDPEEIALLAMQDRIVSSGFFGSTVFCVHLPVAKESDVPYHTFETVAPSSALAIMSPRITRSSCIRPKPTKDMQISIRQKQTRTAITVKLRR